MSQIVVRDLYKVFGSRPKRAIEMLDEGRSKDEINREHGLVVAVQDASFEVERGELFVIMGLSGSGKSTLVRMINRLYEPTAGTIEIDGEDVTALDRKQLRQLRMEKISMVFQHFALFPHMKVWQNAAYGLEVQQVPQQERRERAERSLERVGLSGWGDRYPRNLSGGMQQRVGLARGLATEADIMLMDEPFSALDPLIRRDMQDLLAELQRELQRTIVFITHDLNEAMRLGDRIAVLKDGAIVQIGTGAEIIAEPANDYVADFVADVDRSRVITADIVMRPPQATVGPEDRPRDVLRKLEGLEQNGLYCLDDDGRILGVARDDRCAEAAGTDRTVEDLLVQRYARVRSDTPLVNVSALSARDTVPVAVVGDDDRLLGVIPRAALLAALAPDEGSPGTSADQETPESAVGTRSGGARHDEVSEFRATAKSQEVTPDA